MTQERLPGEFWRGNVYDKQGDETHDLVLCMVDGDVSASCVEKPWAVHPRLTVIAMAEALKAERAEKSKLLAATSAVTSQLMHLQSEHDALVIYIRTMLSDLGIKP